MHDVLLFLRQSGAASGFPLVVAGLSLMAFGWRMWKVCVMLSYALIGAGASAHFLGPSDHQYTVAIGAAVVLGLLSYWPVNLSVSMLGGLIGAVATMYYLVLMGWSGVPLWSAGAAAMLSATGYGFLHRQHVVVFMTALIGAGLLTAGVTALLVSWPHFYNMLRTLTDESIIVVPFLLLVPTCASCFYQLSEMRRAQTSI